MVDNEMNIASFVDFFDFELPGKVFNSAIALGDVDNDNEMELVIGSVEGDLFIFKGHQLFQKISGLGIITAIAIGDLMNCGSNTLIAISADGWCHIYLCLKCSKLNPYDECIMKLEPVHHQRIPANTKVIILGDIDSDGMLELIVGSTDRVVHSYRWSQNAAAGRLVQLHKWGCANQIGSIILIKDIKNRPCLLVSQPGVTAVCFYCPTAFPELNGKTIEYENENELPIEHLNPLISSVMIGNLKVDIKCDQELFDKTDNLYGIASLNGLVMLAKKEKILWSKNIDQELFVINKLSIADDGPDYLITCSLNGDTFIVDQKSQHATFKLGESVSAFCCGMYTAKPNTKSMPSFVFITNSQTVFIYYGLKIPNTCVQSLSKCIENDNHLSTFMEKYEDPLKKKIIRDCLYKYNPNKI